MKSILRVLCLLLILSLGCSALAEVTFPKSAETVEEQAFYKAASLTTARLPEGITTIEKQAFACSGMVCVNLPSTLTYIADDAFEGCPAWLVLYAEEGTYAYDWAQTSGFTVMTNAPKSFATVTISGGNCNIRSEPNTSGTIYGVAHAGDTLPYLGEMSSEGWLKVLYIGKEAWVSGKYGKTVAPGTVTETSTSTGTAIVDISKWQGTINFDKLKPAVALVIARASCGTTKDVKFDEYAKAMNARGIPFGVYCYSKASSSADVREEARTLVSIAKAYNPLFYIMDAETDDLTYTLIGQFADELRANGAKKVGCYCGHAHYAGYNYDKCRDKYDFTWIPRYGSDDGTLEGSIKPKYKCDLWQFTSKGRLPGISGDCDLNVITGTGHDLKWFLQR